MHQFTANELRLDFLITPVSPLSIQTHASIPPRFVRAIHPDANVPSIYIPASTMKGSLRFGAEQTLRSAGMDCCDPDHPCAERDAVKQARAKGGPALYQALCTACRLFGSRVMRSHLIVSDSFPAMPIDTLPTRDSDRVSEEALETVLNEQFFGTLTLRNFERWQVGLLGLLLAHVNIADIQIGGNRASGMGCVELRYKCLSLVYPDNDLDAERQDTLRTRLHGVGHLMGARNPYGYIYPDADDVPDLPEIAELNTGPGYVVVVIQGSPDESDDLDKTHGLIDSVLTRQALAWGNYARTHKSRAHDIPTL